MGGGGGGGAYPDQIINVGMIGHRQVPKTQGF